METLLITLKNGKVRKLLQDLEELEILEIMETSYLRKKSGSKKISDLTVAEPMNEEAINQKLEEIRNEWQRNI